MSKFFKSSGSLVYFDNYKLVVEVDQEISNYYYSLIPKYLHPRRQKYPAHITVIRHIRELPVNLEHWNKYQGKIIDFIYENRIYQGKVYFWLNCFSVELENIKLELGMSIKEEYDIPPKGFKKCFHMTIANCKE